VFVNWIIRGVVPHLITTNNIVGRSFNLIISMSKVACYKLDLFASISCSLIRTIRGGHHHNDYAISDHWWDHDHYRLFMFSGHHHK
jgi:hypothetical protein